LNQQIQLVHVNRFNEMMIEACVLGFAQVVFHSKTRQRDGESGSIGPQPAD